MADQQEQTYQPLPILRPSCPFRIEITEGSAFDFFEQKSKEYLHQYYVAIYDAAKKPENESEDSCKYRRVRFNNNKRKVKEFWSYITRNYSMREMKQEDFWDQKLYIFVDIWYQKYFPLYFGYDHISDLGRLNPVYKCIRNMIFANSQEEEKGKKLIQDKFLEELWDAQGIPYLNSIKFEK